MLVVWDESYMKRGIAGTYKFVSCMSRTLHVKHYNQQILMRSQFVITEVADCLLKGFKFDLQIKY
jgi:hypothetical protein